MRFPTIAFACAIASLPSWVSAQTKIFTISATPAFVFAGQLVDDKGNAVIDVTDGSVKADQIRPLVGAILAGYGVTSERQIDDAFILHTLVWDKNYKTIAQQHWYVDQDTTTDVGAYINRQAHAQKVIETPRIFGKKNVWLLYVHFFKNGTFESSLPALSYKVTINQTQSQLSQDFKGLLSIVTGATAQPSVGYLMAYRFAVDRLPSTVAVSASIQTPAVSPPSGTAANPVQSAPSPPPAGGQSPTPTSTSAPSDQTQIGSQTVLDESKSLLDFSVAFPIKSFSELSYSSATSTITPQQTSRQNVYAVADFYFIPADLTSAGFTLVPHAMFGLPLASDPLNNVMLGLAVSLKYLEPFVGVVFNRTTQPQAAGSGSSSVVSTNQKFIYGLNISVSAAKSLIKGK
jgi:hypothetical protein